MSNFVPEKTALGIEFGSTRIKAVLIGPEHTPLAQGDYTWENQLHNGIWTYPLEQVWQGLQSAYAALAADVQQKTPLELFEELYELQNNQPMSEEQRDFAQNLIERIREEHA